MAAKDADLAYDYAADRLALTEHLDATFELHATNESAETELAFLFVIDSGPFGGSGVTYRMRGYDSDLSRYVYWSSTKVDALGDDYGGNSGALGDVVVQNIVGQV